MGSALLTVMTTPAENRVYELRTYITKEGKLDALLARFRDHTLRLFEKHGMVNVGYWVPKDEPSSKNTLIYVVSHSTREGANASWDAFRTDPEWLEVKAASEAAGPIIERIESLFLEPADLSALK